VRPRFVAMGLAAALVSLGGPSSASAVTETFGFTGAAQTFTVPAEVTQATFTLYGAEGGGAGSGASAGGPGGSATATIVVIPGETLQLNVGGPGADGASGENAAGGFNGGGSVSGCVGADNGGAGGGASDVRRDADADTAFVLDERLLIAGGGGGASNFAGRSGGSGGGTAGGAGIGGIGGGGGGTQSGGGAAGAGGSPGGVDGQDGQLGEGADSTICTGAGGGGLYGGGSGAERFIPPPSSGAGGGGSGFTPDGSGMTNGVRAGDGEVTITYQAPAPQPEPESAADSSPPNVTITDGPKGRTSRTSASFEFESSEPGSTFECRKFRTDKPKTQSHPFLPCDSPKTFTDLRHGRRVFEVRATDAAGNTDPSPATYVWKVRKG
jgi:hypothetical protein